MQWHLYFNMDVAFAIFVKEQCGNPYVAMKQSNMQQ